MCTIATCSWPFFKQAAIMNMAYPLFILVACKSDPLKAYKEGGHAHGHLLPCRHCSIRQCSAHSLWLMLAA